MGVLQTARPLGATDDLGAFSCGDSSMDEWVREKAHRAQASRSASVWVCEDGKGNVCGVFAFDHRRVVPADVTGSAAGGLTEIPALLLARFALRVDLRGAGVGEALMTEVFIAARESLAYVPARVLILDAKNARLAKWYEEKLDFVPTKTDPLKLYMPMKKLLATLDVVGL
ncbi:hypothetical protein EDF28_3621 [Curtobacterium sp. PhB137]|nr:hypothetical protein EDF28_3621 [Curtobacterium sp. PhB137]